MVERQTEQLRPQLEEGGFAWGAPVFIRAFKQERELELWIEDGDRYRLFRTWPICAASGELGPKLAEGDHQVPEGFYYVTPAQMNPNSSWHLSMNVGYPNEFDRHHGRTGSYIMIHGVCGSSGCLSMTDPVVEEIYTLVEAAMVGGQSVIRVHIFPFRMESEDAWNRHAGSEWEDFWRNLQEGYEWFDRFGSPPNVEVSEGRYVFEELP